MIVAANIPLDPIFAGRPQLVTTLDFVSPGIPDCTPVVIDHGPVGTHGYEGKHARSCRDGETPDGYLKLLPNGGSAVFRVAP